jgi:hypothetical protein
MTKRAIKALCEGQDANRARQLMSRFKPSNANERRNETHHPIQAHSEIAIKGMSSLGPS